MNFNLYIFTSENTNLYFCIFFSLSRNVETCRIAFKTSIFYSKRLQSGPHCCNTQTRSKANGQHNILEMKTRTWETRWNKIENTLDEKQDGSDQKYENWNQTINDLKQMKFRIVFFFPTIKCMWKLIYFCKLNILTTNNFLYTMPCY